MRFRRKITSMDDVTVPRNVSIFTKKKSICYQKPLKLEKKEISIYLFSYLFFTHSHVLHCRNN